MKSSLRATQYLKRLASNRKFCLLTAVILLVGFSLLIQIPWSPPNQKVHVDGTAFAYGGQRILDGDIPYRDFWDHKPPGVFYLNAIAFWIMGSDAWALWYLALIWTIAIAGSFYWLLRRFISCWSTLVISLILLATLPIFNEGLNLTEFYAILPSILALIFTYLYFSKRHPIALFALGVAFTGALLLKHTNIGTSIACIAVVAFVDLRRFGLQRAMKKLILIPFFPGMTLLAIVIYWGVNGALNDLWQATVIYNFGRYVSGSSFLMNIYGTLRNTAAAKSVGPLLVIALGAGIAHWRSRQTWSDLRSLDPDQAGLGNLVGAWFYLACFVSLFSELFFISLSGGGYGHHYITLFPALCASVSYWFWADAPTRSISESDKKNSHKLPPTVLAALLVWLLIIFGIVRPSPTHIANFIKDAPRRHPLRTNVGKYVVEITDPDDAVFVWDIGAEINFETQRRNSTKIIYFHHLFSGGSEELWDEFIRDLEEDAPTLIVSQWNGGYAPKFDAPVEELTQNCNCDGFKLEGFTALSNIVKENYERELLFGESFAFYHLKTSDQDNGDPE